MKPHTNNGVSTSDGIPFRYLAINVGNAGWTCWESKLCDPAVVANIRKYIDDWQPDVILISEVYRQSQLIGTDIGGPILPNGYDGKCHASYDRFTNEIVDYNTENASHEHECVAWKTSRVKPIEGSENFVFGRNDSYGVGECNYDFTAFSMDLNIDGRYNLTGIALHPDSMKEDCRRYEIKQYWEQLARVDPNGNSNSNVFIGGDWNCGKSCNPVSCRDSTDEIQKPESFQIIYQVGQHWGMHQDEKDEPTAIYVDGFIYEWLDNDYSNFGSPCTNCGKYYNTTSLKWASSVGGYGDMPRADGGSGCDHRQVLIDMWLTDDNTRTQS